MDSRQQALLIHALQAAANAIIITDHSGRIIWLNDAFCRLSGYGKEEILGCTPHLVHSGKHAPEFYRHLWETIASGRPWHGEVIERRRDGTLYTVDQVITPLITGDGKVTHYLAIQHDITEHHQHVEEVQRLAYHDSLTGLPNRGLFLERLEQAVAGASREQQMLAVMFLDLDRFKAVNDTLGHAIGDRLLIAVADRLSGAVRKTNTVARLGGDEFTLIIPNLDSPERAGILAGDLIALLNKPYAFDEHRVEIGACIGISLYPTDADSATNLLIRADSAMYRAKAEGRNGYRFYDPDVDKT